MPVSCAVATTRSRRSAWLSAWATDTGPPRTSRSTESPRRADDDNARVQRDADAGIASAWPSPSSRSPSAVRQASAACPSSGSGAPKDATSSFSEIVSTVPPLFAHHFGSPREQGIDQFQRDLGGQHPPWLGTA